MPAYHATKYDSARDEVVALLADEMSGYGDRAFGDVESPVGYVQTVALLPETGFDLVTPDESSTSETDKYIDDLVRDHEVTTTDVAGFHLVTTNSQGFVSVVTYATRAELDAVAEALDAAYSEWLGDDE